MKKDKLREALEKIEFDPNLFKNQTGPQCGGVITKKCRSCGGTVITTGEGILQEVCSSCNKPHFDTIYGD